MKKKYTIQKSPFVVPTNDGKLIEEHFGLASDKNQAISIAHMIAPPHWKEPFKLLNLTNIPISSKEKNNLLLREKLLF